MLKKLSLVLLLLFFVTIVGCLEEKEDPRVHVEVKKDITTGLTVEQSNIKSRLLNDNIPGAIKHLYIISAYSGQTLMYSTVKGKVTSSGKRLKPANDLLGMEPKYQVEAIGDDGSYGSSAEYIYWWDSKGVFHQQYITGGMILHISDQPVAVSSITLNLENTTEK